MPGSKVSALTALSAEPADTDEFYINDGGVSKKIAWSTLKAVFALAAQGTLADSALQDVVDDTTPQLGAALDGQGFDLNNLGVVFLTEQAAAEADVAGKGQFWVETATPNVAKFTDDAGTDQSIYMAGGNIPQTGLHKRSVTAGITADVGSAQGGSPLTTEINQISTCATAGDSVTLPTAVAGLRVTIINNGAESCDVFPASGDNLGAGADTAAALAAGANITYVAYDATNWFAVT